MRLALSRVSHTALTAAAATKTLDWASEVLVGKQDIRNVLNLSRKLVVEHLESGVNEMRFPGGANSCIVELVLDGRLQWIVVRRWLSSLHANVLDGTESFNLELRLCESVA